LVFEVSDRLLALPLDAIERITPMAALASPPGLPSTLEGVLDLGGEAMPVLRLDRLLTLPRQRLGIYSVLAIVKGMARGRIALLVDRVSGTLSIPEDQLLPLEGRGSLNGCAQATVLIQGSTAHLLSLSQVLLAQEKDALEEFQALAQSRLATWGAV
jgi:purine-binding chemotaxis protein CheW